MGSPKLSDAFQAATLHVQVRPRDQLPIAATPLGKLAGVPQLHP